MTRLILPLIGLALALCVAVAAAADEVAFFADLLAGSTGSAKARTAAQNSKHGYATAETELSCLQQLNFKNCRTTGCDDRRCVPNFFFQTDFSCCPKEVSYSQPEDMHVGQVGFSDRVGTCDWEFSLYKWRNDGIFGSDLVPVVTDDGTALKFGTAWGTCYLNANADHCDSPLCDRMALNIQGGIYIGFAYGDVPFLDIPNLISQLSTLEDTCGGGQPSLPFFLSGPRNGVPTPVQTPVPTPEIAQSAGTPASFADTLGAMFEVAEPILTGTPPEQSRLKGKFATSGSNSRQQPPVKVGVAYEQDKQKKLYGGIALIISGPFTVTSSLSGKVAETGMFQWSPLFVGLDLVGLVAGQDAPLNNKWPVVRNRGVKLRFSKEKDVSYSNGYGGGSKEEEYRREGYGQDYYEKREHYRE